MFKSLTPTVIERMARLRGDLRLGLPVILTDEGGAALAVPVETLDSARYAALTQDQPRLELVLTRQRALALGVQVESAAPVLRFHLDTDTELAWLTAIVDPTRPQVTSSGVLPTHMACSPVHQAAVSLARSVQLLPAVLMRPLPDHGVQALRQGLSGMSARDVLRELSGPRPQSLVSSARLPMRSFDAGRVHVFRPDDGTIEHFAIEIGEPDKTRPVLTRLHSACFTGDVMGSTKCDCGPQLHAACSIMAAAGGGFLLYLNQEGRGIGLANKMRAYSLQDGGLDTVEANHHLGFEDDERDFRVGAELLARLGIGSVRLLTNNPAKVATLAAHGVRVAERVPLQVGHTVQNAGYLATKAAKSGHLLK